MMMQYPITKHHTCCRMFPLMPNNKNLNSHVAHVSEG